MARIDAMDQVEDGGSRTAAAAASGGGVGGSIEGGGGGRTKPERLPCPRCESTDTKFCYYNNYNLQQPRHFCKGCRRYWTRGGALRNVPVGGGTRKATPAGRRKRASSSHAAAPAPAAAAPVPLSVPAPLPLPLLLPPPPPPPYELSFVPALAAMDPDRRLLDLGGSFSSLLAPAPLHSGHFPNGYVLGGAAAGQVPTPAPPQPPVSQAQPEGFWGMGWPDLSI